MNLSQIKAIEKKQKQRILKVCPTANERSGIYFLTRRENGEKYAYIGQAKHILTRLAQHLVDYKLHIDISLKKHRLYNEENNKGWDIHFIECEETEMNRLEKEYIKKYQDNGYDLRNKTAGGQDTGKVKIAEFKPAKKYTDGLKQGRKNARKEVAKLFDKNLVCSINGNPNKNKEKAFEKFNQFINLEEKDD